MEILYFEVQVAILTKRIVNLTEHFKTHKKTIIQEEASKNGFFETKAIDYVREKDENRYQELIKTGNQKIKFWFLFVKFTKTKAKHV